MWVNMTKKKELNLILQVLNGEITGYSISKEMGVHPGNIGTKAYAVLRRAVRQKRITITKNF